MYLLVVGDVYGADNAGNLGAEWRQVAANIGIVGNLFHLAALPGIPVPGNGNHDRESEQHNQNRREVFLPTRGRCCCCVLFFARRFRLRCRCWRGERE